MDNTNLNQNIQSKLALQVAQLTLDKATLETQFEHLQQFAELQQQLEEVTAPEEIKEGE